MGSSAIAFAAPGGVNLIGEHTDYNLGFALSIAIPQRTVVSFEPGECAHIRARSTHTDGAVRIDLDTEPADVRGWAGYVAGVVWALHRAGYPVPVA